MLLLFSHITHFLQLLIIKVFNPLVHNYTTHLEAVTRFNIYNINNTIMQKARNKNIIDKNIESA